MKKKMFLLHAWLLFAFFTGFSQPQLWQNVNLGSFNCKFIRGIYAVNDDLVLAVGSRFILRSEDGGNTWQEQSSPNGSVLNDVHFVNDSTGFVIGYGIFRTSDGGKTWAEVLSSTYCYHIDFADENEGWVTTSVGKLFHTTDGGDTWQTVPLNFNTAPADVEAISSNSLFLSLDISGGGGIIWHSTDGGATGSLLSTPSPVKSLHFPTTTDGYGVGDFGLFVSTHNGSSNWVPDTIAPNVHFIAVHFANASLGYALASGGELYKTEDAGQSWVALNLGLTPIMTDVFSADGSEVFVVGDDGVIFHSSDGGDAWELEATGEILVCASLQSIFATSPSHAIACGISGTVITTDDAGLTWQYANLPPDWRYATCYAVHFITSSIGFIGGSGGILKSPDGGQNWQAATMSGLGATIHDLHFPAGSTTIGYACTNGGGVFKTTDGGNTWVQLDSFTSQCLDGIHFTDENHGWVVGSGYAGHTSDGGLSWVEVIIDDSLSVSGTDVQFVNATLGFIASGDGVFRSKDGGQTWEQVLGYAEAVHFTDAQSGWVVGGNGIFHTPDGGDSWVQETIPVSSGWLNAVHFITPTTGFAAGESTILKYDRSVTLCLDTLIGASGTTLEVSVRVRDFNQIKSFQMKIRSSNASVVKILDVISSGTLPGNLTKLVSGAGDYAFVLWTGGTNCDVALPDDAVIFRLKVHLIGSPGACVDLYFDNSPAGVKVYQCNGQDASVSIPVNQKQGQVCIANDAKVCGKISIHSGDPKAGVEVTVNTVPGPSPSSVFTDADGNYCIKIPAGVDATCNPQHDTLWGVEVDVADYQKLQNFLDGVAPLTEGWQKWAGDVNHDGTLKQDDVGALASVIFEPDQPIPNNISWRFVPYLHWPLPLSQDPAVPYAPEWLDYLDIATDQTGQNYVAIKVGDLNGSANFTTEDGAEDRQAGSLVFWVEKEFLPEQNAWLFHFRSPDFQGITSWQAAVAFQPQGFVFQQLVPGSLEQIVLDESKVSEGILPLLWFDRQHTETGVTLASEDVLFSLRFAATRPGKDAEAALGLATTPMQSLGYRHGVSAAIELKVAGSKDNSTAWLLPNQPNPWSERTVFLCFAPQVMRQPQLVVTDLRGVEVQRQDLTAGLEQSVELSREALTPGIYFVHLVAEGKVQARQKMAVTGR